MDWRQRISRPGTPAQPMFVHRMGRTFWVPPRYRHIAEATFSGERFTLRDLARRLGYSVTGLRHALARMSGWGMFRLVTRRGRRGFTRLVWSDDVSSRNVPSASSANAPRRNLTVTVDGTNRPAGLVALGEVMARLGLGDAR